jgi:protein tyrosine/serine phosphatase
MHPTFKNHKNKWIGLLCFLAFAAFVYRSSVFRISQNFYTVEEGKFYRSAQQTPEELEEHIRKHGIKTVISLRGAPKNSYWVQPQVDALAKNNVKFVPLSWTIDYFPATDALQEYFKVLQDPANYPILVHCKTGADRTGLASALYAIEYMRQPVEEALDRQLSFKNWHVRSFHPAMSEFARIYKGIDWALLKYNHCASDYKSWSEPGHCPD